MGSGTTSGVKERLFCAAVRVFAAKGYKGATVRDICREAEGANLNSVQYYFGGKDKLYQAVLEVLFTEGDRRVRQRLESDEEALPETRLKLLLEVFCQVLFSQSEIGDAFLRLWAMELANPTPFFGDMIERHSRPQTLAMLDILSGILGPRASLEVLVECMMSVLGPAVYQALLWPTLQRMFPEHPPMTEHWPHLADHLYRFCMAGLAAVRETLGE
ncbi:transcriptional regulator, TetR family [Solidesulfovibrio fructosivorans JJ]]|uniref:Transcriptional regulator, TetR family n=1 Tax=Solidesulfovibrio fructosivorans JJ] TaxID=596151 RepID=E1JW43_SOLFR|nr:CerR family C-terminal domain-containing protein [Solidesulfovibrio fructosivorans]EFL51403.1 transcriptional regulator, TetR family [Solidesulfovibrio fructosivorans JJ]]